MALIYHHHVSEALLDLLSNLIDMTRELVDCNCMVNAILSVDLEDLEDLHLSLIDISSISRELMCLRESRVEAAWEFLWSKLLDLLSSG